VRSDASVGTIDRVIPVLRGAAWWIGTLLGCVALFALLAWSASEESEAWEVYATPRVVPGVVLGVAIAAWRSRRKRTPHGEQKSRQRAVRVGRVFK
jgi:peptidoglycan/LPS O-acetylase OafA/YrhL